MCGIAGYISEFIFSEEEVIKEQVHRGPDDQGFYKYSIGAKNILLIHNRLSIIDLSAAGHQPMISDNEQYILVYNGEIYNYKELQQKYLKNISLKSYSDTEVILHLYIQLGIRFVKELNGDFSFSILDKKAGKIFLVRDHTGVKPLYYTSNSKGFAFASEIKGLRPFLSKLELNQDELENYFVFKYSPGTSTLFKGVKRLSPGHILEYDIQKNKFNIGSYWQLNKNNSYAGISFNDAQEQLKYILEDAIKIRLMSDVPLGTFFSGGIDSSIIAWYLKKQNDIIHYTARKTKHDLQQEGTTDDFAYASFLADKWGLELFPVDIGTDEANPELIAKTVFFGDDLIADGSQIPSYLISREATKNTTVMLSGMGADELFFGYRTHLMALLTNYLDKLPGFASNALASFLGKLNQGKGRFKSYKRHLHQFGKYYLTPSAIRAGLFGVVGDYNNATSVMSHPQGSALSVFKSYFDNQNDLFDNNFHFEKDNFLVKNLHYVDRMCMANSMEGRVPFLDYRLVEFAYSIPTSFKIKGNGRLKHILKEAYKEVLPKDLINRRKAGFGMPLRSILSDRDRVFQLLDPEFFGSFDYFNIDEIQKCIQNHMDGREDNSSLIYALISFRIWYLTWIKG